MAPGRLELLQHALAGKWLHIAGDSTMRFIYYDLVHLLSGSKQFGIPVVDQTVLDQRLAMRHSDQETKLPQGIRISFHWAPFVANISLDLQHLLAPSDVDKFGSPLPQTSDQPPLRTPDIIFNGCGLWSLLYQEETTSERELNLQQEAHALAEVLFSYNWALQEDEWAGKMFPGAVGTERFQREWTKNGRGYVDWKQKRSAGQT